jgi:hypothetical protein
MLMFIPAMYSPYRIFLVFLFAILILNGCILERIFRVQKQFCDYEKYFKIEVSEGFRVILLEPVLLDKDITKLAGAQPSKKKFIRNEQVMIYIAERKGKPNHGQFDLPVELRFIYNDGEYRLKEAYLGKNLTDVLTDKLLTQIIQSVCRSEKSLVKQQITVDIRALDRTLLPTRSEITSILGPPNSKTGLQHRQLYDYQLKNNGHADKVIIVEIDFDGSGNKIHRIKVKYLGYNLEADLDKGEAILSVDIFDIGEL